MTLVEKLVSISVSDPPWDEVGNVYVRKVSAEAADAITRLTTLNEGYKGQVESGASEIARLEVELVEVKAKHDHLPKRPVAFRIPTNAPSAYIVTVSETEAQYEAERRGVAYEGLYLIRDRAGNK